MTNQLPQEIVIQIQELCSITKERSAFVFATRSFVDDFLFADSTGAKLRVFQKIILFLSLTPHNWTSYQKFVAVVKAKLREFGDYLHVHCPEHMSAVWEMVDQVNQRCCTLTCFAATVSGGRCTRRVDTQTTFFTRCCTQHRKIFEVKFAMIILGMGSELPPDLLWTIARVAVDRRLYTSLPLSM